jgi:hypothetical protein
MATVIKIKQSGKQAAAAEDLSQGELGYTFGEATVVATEAQVTGGSRLYIGNGDQYTQNLVIGGSYFTNMLDHAHGTLTADSAIIVKADKKIDVLNVDNITLDGNTISITDTDGDLTLKANGTTGKIIFESSQQFDGHLTIGSSEIDNGAYANLKNLKVYGSATVDDLKIDGNTITANGDLFDDNGSDVPNRSITITPKGVGDVELGISGKGVLRIPAGDVGDRKTASSGTVSDTHAANGSIRYNTSTHRFEGVASGQWTGLGGVVDIDQNTYISAETWTAGIPQDDNTLRFFIADTEEMTLNANELQIDVINGKTAQGSLGQVKVDTNLLVSGNLTVEGTTTTVDSTVVTIADPVMHLGEGSLVLDDGLDRGVTFDYGNGTAVKTGFFGFDIQTSKFVFKPDTSVATAPVAVTVAASTRVPTLVDWTQRAYSGITEAQYNNGSGASIAIAAYTYTPEDFSAAWGDVAFGNMALSADATIAGTLGVTEATTLTGLLNANGGILVNTDKFTVAASDGDVVTKGTLDVDGLSMLLGGITVSTETAVPGTFLNHFTVDGANGDVVTTGTLDVDGASSFNKKTGLVTAADQANTKVTIGTSPEDWDGSTSDVYNAYSEGVIVKHAAKYYIYKGVTTPPWTMETANNAPNATTVAADTAWEEINYKEPMVIDFAGRMTDGVITGATIIDCGTF